MKSNRKILILTITLFVVIATYIECASNNKLKKLEFLAQKTEITLQKAQVATKKAETDLLLAAENYSKSKTRLGNKFIKIIIT